MTVLAMKELVEVLARQRGDIGNSAVTWDDLLKLNQPETGTGKPLIDPRAVPRKLGT
jgi:hypothetical protein